MYSNCLLIYKSNEAFLLKKLGALYFRKKEVRQMYLSSFELLGIILNF